MYLMPGDSPMGYRLPLDSVPWVSKTDYPYMIEPTLRAAAGPAGRFRAGRALQRQLQRGPRRHAGGAFGRRQRQFAGAVHGALHGGQHRAVAGQPHFAVPPAGQQRHPADGKPAGAAAEAAAGRFDDRAPKPFESAAWLTRTALCVEVRDPQRANDKPKADRDSKANTSAAAKPA
jgi:uncharacterized protein (DUF2126 family)